ncbi:MAG: pitrilysin family protein [Woeseiaceae bacterium]|jgi:zinc protease
MKRLLLLLLLSPGLAWSQDISLPDYERVVLDNGAVLLLAEKHDIPLVGLRAVVRGGSITDPADRSGMAGLLASLMQKGAGEREAAAFAEAAAEVGGTLSASASAEAISVSAEFLSRDAALMVELAADMLLRPALAEDEFLKERDRAVATIAAARRSNPSALLPAYTQAFVFGDHPYGHPSFGSETSLADLAHEELLQFYADQFGGDRLIVAVVGDFELEAMKSRLTGAFGQWAPAAAALPEVAAAPRIEGRRVLLVDKPGSAQTYFWLGNVGVAIDYPQRAELRIANTLFGGRFTSMLMTALRVEGGLTYSAYSVVDQLSAPGAVTIRSYTETSRTTEAIDVAIEELDRLHRRGVDGDMLASARNYIMGQYPPTLETSMAVAATLAFLEQHGLDRTYIDDYGTALTAATPASVQDVINEVYPLPENLALVMIGDAEAIRDDIARYGPVTEVAITEPGFRPQK